MADGAIMARAAPGHELTDASVGQVSAYEAELASMFSDLFQPIELNRGGTGSYDLHRATGRTGVDGCPESTYLLAAALLGARRMAQAAQLLAGLDNVTAHRPDHQRWTGRMEFLWAIYAQQIADPAEVLQHCAAAARSMGPRSQGRAYPHQDQGSDSCLRTVDAVIWDQLPVLAARAQIALGETRKAEAFLLERYGGPEQAEASQPATMALLASHQGRLGAATRLATAALEAATRQDTGGELVDLEARLVLAEVFFERNQLDASWRDLHACLRLCWLTSAIPWMWAIEIDLARVKVAQGEATEAMHRIEHLRVKGAGFFSQPLLQKLNQVAIECRLQLGDLDGALQIVRSSLPADIPCETLARVDLSSGRPDQALTRLSISPSPDLAIHIRRLLLAARAEHQQGREQRAYDATRRAVEAAQPERYLRPFLEDPAQTLPLLQGLAGDFSNPYLVSLIKETEKLVPHAHPPGVALLLEPLTDRERQILRYLPSHLTLRQIGVLMCLSTNTVKTHVKSIYRKVGAISRDDAVTTARSHGLV
jgi:LuxR family maltose regulon positive regulatory protein